MHQADVFSNPFIDCDTADFHALKPEILAEACPRGTQ